MYNLFVTANLGAWDTFRYEYDKSRFLEYTNEKIVRQFKGLSAKQQEKLKSLPCLFVYEGTEEPVRLGRLVSISDRDKTVLIEFEFYPIPEIPYSEIFRIADLLDFRAWEAYRTHWAVKDENLIERLRANSILTPESYTVIITSRESTTSQTSFSSPSIKKPDPGITTVKGFIEKVLAGKRNQEKEERQVRWPLKLHSRRRGYSLSFFYSQLLFPDAQLQ